jgi:excisionase family DNA binding protein
MTESDERRSPLFVRLTSEQAERLHRAAAAVPARKNALIGGLVERYVDPESKEGVARLREIAGAPRRVTVDLGGEAPVVGHYGFRPAPEPPVLDPAQAAELLQVPEETVLDLAERGEIPGRRIGDAWRFSRRALLAWLG